MFPNNITILVPRKFFLHRRLIEKQTRPALDTPKQEESLQEKKKEKTGTNQRKLLKVSKNFLNINALPSLGNQYPHVIVNYTLKSYFLLLRNFLLASLQMF